MTITIDTHQNRAQAAADVLAAWLVEQWRRRARGQAHPNDTELRLVEAFVHDLDDVL